MFPESLVTGRAFATARLVLLLGAIALAMELLVLWWVLRHQVSRPLAQLMGATARVGAGDYQVRLDAAPNNELGRLAQSFNLMSAEICRTVERLKETTVSRSYLDSIIQNTGEGIITLDERGFISSTNPAAEEIFRVQPGQLLGRLFNFLSEGREMFMQFLCPVSGHADGVRAWRARGACAPTARHQWCAPMPSLRG